MDRNIKADVSYNIQETSLSARRAWIEITTRTRTPIGCVVALRKESVDRNKKTDVAGAVEILGRSPQGERG